MDGEERKRTNESRMAKWLCYFCSTAGSSCTAIKANIQ
jgi:hypothetical protein